MDDLKLLIAEMDRLEQTRANPERFIELGEQIVEIDSGNVKVWARLATHFEQRGEWERALAEWETMYQANAESSVARKGLRIAGPLAQQFRERRLQREADRVRLAQRLESSTDYSELLEIGLMMKRSGDVLAADRAFGRAVDVVKEGHEPREICQVASAIRRQGLPEIALPLAEYAATRLNDEYALAVLARSFRALGKSADAVAAYQRARNVRDSKAVRTGLGAVYRDMGRYDEAEQLARSVRAEDPDDLFAVNLLAAVLVDQATKAGSIDETKLAEALELFEQAGARFTATNDGHATLRRLLDHLRAKGDQPAAQRIERIMNALPTTGA